MEETKGGLERITMMEKNIGGARKTSPKEANQSVTSQKIMGSKPTPSKVS